MEGAPISLAKPSPRMGQDNDYVLRSLLDLGDAEIQQLRDEQVIGDEPLDDEMRTGKSGTKSNQ
jgi:hypothetical protein